MLKEQKETVGLAKGGRPTETPAKTEGVLEPLTLEDVGIDYKLSSRAQMLASIPAAEFEEKIVEWREKAEQSDSETIKSHLTRTTGREGYYTPATDSTFRLKVF